MSYASCDYVVEEIAELIANGARIIRFWDDLFTANKRRLESIADVIISKGFHKKATFACWTRASTLSPEVVEILKAMNMAAVYMGLESGCDRSLKFLKGGGSAEQNRKAVMMLKEAKIQANGSFIFGLPDETIDEILETYEFIKGLPLGTLSINTPIPFPGTPLWDYAKKRGIVSDDMDWSRLNDVILSERVTPKEMSALRRKFRRLALLMRVRALPSSPWHARALRRLPKVATMKIVGKVMGMSRSSGRLRL